MRKAVASTAIALFLSLGVGGTAAVAQTSGDNTGAATTQSNDDSGKWGLAGLLGLAGLAGLARRDRRDRADYPGARSATTR
ncbi:MAG TPA: WGxxGxxG family protein [Acidimicrobiales bacterium]|nr:WGxxGxxG family protein [Acidimicrobiales bacterium]HWI02956.1 WGxxGxxG family protein [Acidimicrobiales bacterium]